MKTLLNELIFFTEDLVPFKKAIYEDENGKQTVEADEIEVEYPYHFLIYNPINFLPHIATIYQNENKTRFKGTRPSEEWETTKDGKLCLHEDWTKSPLPVFTGPGTQKPTSLIVTSGFGFWKRLWVLISNPIMYVVIGKIRL